MNSCRWDSDTALIYSSSRHRLTVGWETGGGFRKHSPAYSEVPPKEVIMLFRFRASVETCRVRNELR